MRRRKSFFNGMGAGLALAALLAACSGATPMVATPSATIPWTALPPTPTATLTPVPPATDAPTLSASPSATEPPTPTELLTPQLNAGMNAFCRKGPGTGYYAITFLSAGTMYPILGENGLHTWYLVQAPGNTICWVGDPMAVIQGPAWQAPFVMEPPLPGRPSAFLAAYECDTPLKIWYVTLTWQTQGSISGYHLYRNGDLLKDLDPKTVEYDDNSPPVGVDVNYRLVAYNEFGESEPASKTVPLCGG